MAKRLAVQHAVCSECRAAIDAAPELTFLGLLRFRCPQCGKAFLHPMAARRRKAYIALSVILGVIFIGLFVGTRRIPIPGVLPLALAVALYQDSRVRRRADAARNQTPVARTSPDA
jgi:predicted RNA-binding Zn-ribbon protein involved in translation (DUF1610 family)